MKLLQERSKIIVILSNAAIIVKKITNKYTTRISQKMWKAQSGYNVLNKVIMPLFFQLKLSGRRSIQTYSGTRSFFPVIAHHSPCVIVPCIKLANIGWSTVRSLLPYRTAEDNQTVACMCACACSLHFKTRQNISRISGSWHFRYLPYLKSDYVIQE